MLSLTADAEKKPDRGKDRPAPTSPQKESNMVTVYLNSPPKGRTSFQLQWVDPDTGQRKTKSAKTADPQVAETKRGELEYELNHGIAHEQSKMPWKTFRKVYEEEQLAGRRLATRKKAGYVFDLFEELVNPKTLGHVTERTLSKYVTAMRAHNRRAATIAGHLAYLRAALRWAVTQKFITTAPAVVMPKVPKKATIRKISSEEFERLILHAPTDLWKAFVATAWYTGMRRCEMLDMTWGSDCDTPWIDFAAKKVMIPAAYNKADADQWVPLHPDLERILTPLAKSKGAMFPLCSTPQETSRAFGAIAKKAGFRISLHDLRRSFGSRYAAVVPAPVLKRLMRHASIETTLAFYTDVDDKLAEAILKA